MKSLLRIFILFILVAILCLVGFLTYLFTGQAPLFSEIDFGITFSQYFAEEMSLDWKQAYAAILDELGVKKLRLIAYWQYLEPEQGSYSFEDLDWQIQEAGKRNAQVILAVGRKLPRWPECHIPAWANGLDESEQQEKILSLITKIVEHYQDSKVIWAWQIENEPFLKGFGECPKLDKEFLKKEINLVRKNDSQNRPIIITASGELSSWIQPAFYGDIFGTTLYRNVYSENLGKYIKYPIPPVFYYKRANLTKKITGVEKAIIIELQGETWGPKMPYETPLDKQLEIMNANVFREIIDYTYQTGFDEAYLWGAEWWYWLKQKHGIDNLWQEAKKQFISEG